MLVDYTLSGNAATIHKWIRDSDGRRVHNTETGFEPYFFIHENETVPDDDRIKRVEDKKRWESNKGHPLKKVVAYSPKEVGGRYGLKGEFTETWESDVFFRTRYWLDEIPSDEIPETDYRVCMYDLEVDHSLDAQNAPEPIISIACYDNYLEKYVSFMLAPERNQELPEDHRVETFKKDGWSNYVFDPADYEPTSRMSAQMQAEREMVQKFFEFVDDTDPDILSAWNGETYDDPYLINRCAHLKIDYSELSPVNRVDLIDSGKRVSMKGREMIDLMQAFEKSYFSQLESFKLNSVGANLLDLEKVQFDTSISQLWRDNPSKLIEYNRRDVEIMVKLDEEFDIWGMLQEVQQWVGINLKDILHNSRVTQAYFMRQMESRMPTKGWTEDNESFQGATVLEETPGLSRNVAVLDLKAQYPSSMISYNMSPEMKIDDDMDTGDIAERFLRPITEEESDWTDEELEEKFGYSREELQDAIDGVMDDYGDRLLEVIQEHTIEVGTGAKFWYGEMGAIPKVLIEMIQARDKHKELRDDAEPESDVYEMHDRRQFALKFVINSVYGVMGFPQFPLYDKDVAKSTTYVGRETIKWAVEKARELGYEVIYGDTDSIMISMGEDVTIETAIEKAKKLEDFINEKYDEYAEEMGVDTSRFEDVDREHFFEIEFEKLYKTFFMAKAKKKYAGKIVYKEGKRIDDYDFAQFGKRSGMSQLSRKMQRKVLKMILEEKSKEEVQKYITNVCDKMRDGEYDMDYIGIPGAIKKNFEDYKTDRPVLRGAKYTNEYLDEQFGKGDKPKYVYVKHTPPGLPGTDTVAYSQMTLPEGFGIDWDTMVQKNAQQKLKRILREMDWDWTEMYRQSQSLLDY